MWPRGFEFFQHFTKELHTIFILNTVKEYPNGITYYDLQQMGNIPHSKIYREMKKLEEEGILRREDEKGSVGRQKHCYFLTEAGEKERERIIQSLEKSLNLISSRMSQEHTEEMKHFIEVSTFKVWCTPVDYIFNSELSDEKKIDLFEDLEKDLSDMLDRLRKLKKQLKGRVDS